MNRPGNFVTSQCCCSVHNQGGQHLSSRYRQQAGEDFGINQNPVNFPDNSGLRRNPPCAYYQGNEYPNALDDQTLNTLTSFRQKACQFMRSDSESSGSPSSVRNRPYQNENANPYRDSNVLRQANDLIDYAPQSEFLKKMKQQCQFLQNQQPNVFSTLDNCEEFIPPECQKCLERVKRILTLGEQIRCNRVRSPSPEGPMRGCPCNHQAGINDFSDSQMHERDIQCMYENHRPQRDPRMLGKGNLERIVEEPGERILQKAFRYAEEDGISEKQSEHISRSKKPGQSRGRRKRKSDSSENCESEEEVGPNLKKPHENSCERCWKFASPSRSPVNKPDQRYDPNFRRGHSCVDLRKDRGDGDPESFGRPMLQCKNLQPTGSKDKGPSQTQPSQETQFGRQVAQSNQQKSQSHSQKPDFYQQQPGNNFRQNGSFTKVKELDYNYCPPRSPDKNSLKSLPHKSGGKSSTYPGILQSDTARKPRPKSVTTGQSALKTEELPSYLLDVSEYCDICEKPKQKQSMQSERQRERRGTVGGSRTERPASASANPAVSPLKACSPGTTNRPGPSSRGNSPSQPASRPKTAAGSSPVQSKGGSPKAKSPRSPTGATWSAVESPGSVSTAYAEIKMNKSTGPCSPKKSPQGQSPKKSSRSPSPKSRSRNGKSPRKGPKSSPKGSPKRVHSSSDCFDNLPPNYEGRPQTVFDPRGERQRLPNYGGTYDDYQGGHPITECCCPPRAPFIRNPNSNPTHLICCHCHWGENPRNQTPPNQVIFQSNGPPHQSPNSQPNQITDRQFVSDPNPSRNSPSRCFSPNRSYMPPEDLEMECPYRAFQLEKRAANDTSWEADYQELKELCMNSPDYQFATAASEEKRPQSRGGKKEQLRSSDYVPTKYALFYMTQNKLDKGDEVEVLVEELTQACPKRSDGRTKDITEKMKRIMEECPSDSMALRFQKGVTESCKPPHSSRILYF